MSLGHISKRGIRAGTKPDFLKYLIKVWTNPYDPSNDTGIINLGIAENTLNNDMLCSKLGQFRKENGVSEKTFPYGDMSGTEKMKEHYARIFQDHFLTTAKSTVDPKHITIVAGANVALEQFACAMCDEGEYLMIATPYYFGMGPDFERRMGVKLIEVPMPNVNEWNVKEAFEQAYIKAKKEGKVVRGIVIVNPHNPTGVIRRDEDMQGFLDFVYDHSLHLIADEVYALSLQNNQNFRSIIDYVDTQKDVKKKEALNSLVHVIYSASKDVGLNGWRLGVAYSRNDQINATFDTCADLNCTSRDTLVAWEHFLEKDNFDIYRQRYQQALRQRYSYVETLLNDYKKLNTKDHYIDFEKPQGGIFVFLRCYASTKSEKELQAYFTDQVRVYMPNGGLFKSSQSHYFRICFTQTSEDILTKALHRLLKGFFALNDK